MCGAAPDVLLLDAIREARECDSLKAVLHFLHARRWQSQIQLPDVDLGFRQLAGCRLRSKPLSHRQSSPNNHDPQISRDRGHKL
jgi:hypothetical protein